MPAAPYLNIREVWELRRAAARYPEKWKASGRDITDENRHVIGHMSDPDMVKLVVRTHNMLLPILNKLFVILAKLGDRRAMALEEDESGN